MPIDIDSLTEPELIDLNHRIVARLRVLRDMRPTSGCWSSTSATGSPFNRRDVIRSKRADALQSKDRHGAQWTSSSPVPHRNVQKPTMHHADGANVLILGKR